MTSNKKNKKSIVPAAPYAKRGGPKMISKGFLRGGSSILRRLLTLTIILNVTPIELYLSLIKFLQKPNQEKKLS